MSDMLCKEEIALTGSETVRLFLAAIFFSLSP